MRGFMDVINIKYSGTQAKDALLVQKEEINFENKLFNMSNAVSQKVLKEKTTSRKKANKKGKNTRVKDELN